MERSMCQNAGMMAVVFVVLGQRGRRKGVSVSVCEIGAQPKVSY